MQNYWDTTNYYWPLLVSVNATLLYNVIHIDQYKYQLSCVGIGMMADIWKMLRRSKVQDRLNMLICGPYQPVAVELQDVTRNVVWTSCLVWVFPHECLNLHVNIRLGQSFFTEIVHYRHNEFPLNATLGYLHRTIQRHHNTTPQSECISDNLIALVIFYISFHIFCQGQISVC